MTQARAQLSILGILKEALLTILRNAKILSSFILVILLPLKLLCRIPNLNPPIVLHAASIAPYLLSRLGLSDSPVTINIFPTATIVSHITTSIAVYLSTMCYNGSHLGLNELFSKFKRTWRGLLATIVVCELFTWVYVILFSGFCLIFVMLNITNLWILLIVLVLLFLFLLGFVMSVYVSMVGKLCLVVSIVEEKCYGWGAMRRATGLLVTRKLQGIVLMALMMGVGEIIATAFARLKGDDDRQQQVSASIVVGDVLKIVVDEVFTMLCSLVLTVFYYECKRSKGGGKSGEGFQELLPFTSHVDDAIA